MVEVSVLTSRRGNARSLIRCGILGALVSLVVLSCPSTGWTGSEELFPSFVDRHTLGLWLFDDPEYHLATLTDASENQYDLRLLAGGGLVEGKFGRALRVKSKIGGQLKFPIGFAQEPKHGDFFIATGGRTKVPPGKLLQAMAGREWTWELWVKMVGDEPSSGGTFVEMGSPETLVFSWGLDKEGGTIAALSETGGFSCSFAVDVGALEDGQWHHVALVRRGDISSLRLYVDGRGRGAAPSPRETPPMRPERTFALSFDLLVGYGFADTLRWNGAVDEMRVSDVARYAADFDPPGSFSRNYGKGRSGPSVPNGPRLLFEGDQASVPVDLGHRKHVFIDDILLDQKDLLKVVQNPPAHDRYQVVDMAMRPWEGAPGSGTGQGLGLRDVYDDRGRVHFLIFNDGFWMNDPAMEPSVWSLATSEDGLNLQRPNLGLFEWKGSKDNNIFLLGGAVQGSFFVDTNPNILPEEKYKFSAFSYTRGIYVYVSPDGIHWRRNEVCALPLDVGGGVEMIWDDQKGVYSAYARAHNLPRYRHPPPANPAPGNRYAGYAETTNHGLSDCDAVRSDSTRHIVTWKGRSSMEELEGRAIRLKLAMEDSKLYALQFAD